jgi:type 1 glutamine amidotransferase
MILCLALATLVLRGGSDLPQKPAIGKKALLVWGGDMHEPKQCVDIFAPWLAEQGFDVEVSSTLDCYLDAEKMRVADRIRHPALV